MNKKEGGIVTAIKRQDGTITFNQTEIDKLISEELSKLQVNPVDHTTSDKLPFPALPRLKEEQISQILNSIPKGKGINADMMSCSIASQELRDKATKIIEDL